MVSKCMVSGSGDGPAAGLPAKKEACSFRCVCFCVPCLRWCCPVPGAPCRRCGRNCLAPPPLLPVFPSHCSPRLQWPPPPFLPPPFLLCCGCCVAQGCRCRRRARTRGSLPASLHFLAAPRHFLARRPHFVAAPLHFLARRLHFLAVPLHFLAARLHFWWPPPTHSVCKFSRNPNVWLVPRDLHFLAARLHFLAGGGGHSGSPPLCPHPRWGQTRCPPPPPSPQGKADATSPCHPPALATCYTHIHFAGCAWGCSTPCAVWPG